MLSIAFAAALMLAEGTPVAERQPTSAEPTSAASVAGARLTRDKVVCRYEALVGSRLKKKVCYTKWVADLNRIDTRLTIERIQALAPIG